MHERKAFKDQILNFKNKSLDKKIKEKLLPAQKKAAVGSF